MIMQQIMHIMADMLHISTRGRHLCFSTFGEALETDVWAPSWTQEDDTWNHIGMAGFCHKHKLKVPTSHLPRSMLRSTRFTRKREFGPEEIDQRVGTKATSSS